MSLSSFKFLFIFFIVPCLLSAQTKGATPTASIRTKETVISNTFAVVVGISDYQDPAIPDLKYADKDAEAFAQFLRSDAGGKLDSDHLKLLLNSNASMAQLGNALDWLLEKATENDKVIFYFSGHGDVEKKTITQPGFLLCWDAPARVYIAGGAMALPILQEVISTLSLQNKSKVLVILDACRSGKLAGYTVNGSQATASNLAKQFGNEIKIMSCQPNEYSIEGEQWGGGRGAFSFNLVNGLYGMADTNKDLWVNVQEVSRYLEDHVSPEVAPISQIPMILGDRSANLFAVNAKALTEIKAGKLNQQFYAIDSKGLEDILLSEMDSLLKHYYKLFNQTIRNRQFLEPQNNCAEFYYQKLISETKLQGLHSALKRNYAAALQDAAQQEMNVMLKSGLSLDVLGKQNKIGLYKNYATWLGHAADLLGTTHYMYNTLIARKLFFEAKIQNSAKQRRQLYYEALQWQSNLPHAFSEMIRTCRDTEIDSAEYFASKAMEISPEWVMPYIELSNFYSNKLFDLIKANEYLDKASRIDSNSIVVWLNRGLLFVNKGDFKSGIFWLEKTIKAYNGDICFNCALHSLGDAYIESKMYKEAEEILLKAVQADSTFGGTLNRLGKVYWLTGKYEASEAAFRKEIKLARNERDKSMAYTELGNLYLEQHKIKEAKEFYLESMKRDSSNTNPYFNLCYIYMRDSNFMEAEKYIRLNLKNRLFLANTKTTLGECIIRQGRFEEGIEFVKQGVEMEPSFENLYIYASLLSYINHPDESIKILEQSLQSGYKDYEWIIQDRDMINVKKLEAWNLLMQKYFPDKFKK